jgi:hypothetical protein
MLKGADAHDNISGSFIIAYGGTTGGGRCDEAPGAAFATSASTNDMFQTFTNPPLFKDHLSMNVPSSTSFFAVGESGNNEFCLKSL